MLLEHFLEQNRQHRPQHRGDHGQNKPVHPRREGDVHGGNSELAKGPAAIVGPMSQTDSYR